MTPHFGFQPTYEELKPEKYSLEGKNVLSFQPTYEELKHSSCSLIFPPPRAFSAYLRGIETVPPRGRWYALERVFSLPTRNWNLAFPRFFATSPPGFQPTYEELKHHSSGGEAGMSRDVFSLPTRNWNYCRNFHMSNKISSVFSLPTRNWNKTRMAPSSTRNCSFQPTYEELKLGAGGVRFAVRRRFSAYLRGIETFLGYAEAGGGDLSFQPTYEELKLANKPNAPARSPRVFSLPTRNWNLEECQQLYQTTHRFQPTYEELKRKHISLTSKSFKNVFSLPTRNWNMPCRKSVWDWAEFSAYLRGIETPRTFE